MTTTTEQREYSIHNRGRRFGVVVYVWHEGRVRDCGLNYDLGTFPTRRAAEQAIADDRAVAEHDDAE